MEDFVKKLKDPLRPFGKETDVLPYYAAAAKYLAGFLGGREIATKNHLGGERYLIKRGSQMKPLTAGQVADWVDMKLIEARSKYAHLQDAKAVLNDKQQLLWAYFLPRKLADLFYATNFEKPGRAISRIFLDIDRREGATLEQARSVAVLLLEAVKSDRGFEKLAGGFGTFCFYTGKSFHIYIMLDREKSASFYTNNLTGEGSFTRKWVDAVREHAGVNVIEGHEKKAGQINVDPSQTPSGKLARAPFSLHIDDRRGVVDGVAVPLTEKELGSKGIVEKTAEKTPKDIVREMKELAGKIPAQ